MPRRPTFTPDAYRRITLVATVLLGIIIVTGAAVRLSGSGLGCPDWPTCDGRRLTPHSADDTNAMIEFVNRMFTGLVSITVIVCVLGSLFRVPRRRDLVWLSAGLVVGVFLQAVLGGLTVLFELQPEFVMSHFLVSLVLLTNALVLHRRAGEPEGPATSVVGPSVRTLGRVLLLVAAVVVISGTVVTSTGPHGGDKEVPRFALSLSEVARVHGVTVVTFLVLVLVTLGLLRRTGAPKNVQQRGLVLLGLLLVQAAVGYVQYFNDIPALLVGFHVAGATLVWAAVVALYLGMSRREPAADVRPDPPREHALAPA